MTELPSATCEIAEFIIGNIDEDGDDDSSVVGMDDDGDGSIDEGDVKDDDEDGFIDCFDSDCSMVPDCAGSFVSDQPNCEVIPAVASFDLAQEWASPNRTATNLSTIAIGDLDGDGIPEVVLWLSSQLT